MGPTTRRDQAQFNPDRLTTIGTKVDLWLCRHDSPERLERITLKYKGSHIGFTPLRFNFAYLLLTEQGGPPL